MSGKKGNIARIVFISKDFLQYIWGQKEEEQYV